MPFPHLDQLALWLAEAGIDGLELIGPKLRLRLGSAAQDGYQARPADTAVEPAEVVSQAAQAVTVVAPMAGRLLYCHPMRRDLLAPRESRVRAGQTIALLQIGALLVPIDAACEGIVAEVMAQEGALVGFGTALIRLSNIGSET